jgi:predicted permease
MDHGLQDLRLAFRRLSQNPALSLAIVLVMALGSGSASVVMVFLQGLVLRPLPFERPEELVALRMENAAAGIGEGDWSDPDFLDLRGQIEGLRGLAAVDERDVVVSTAEGAERYSAALVSPELFTTLGLEPEWGRRFHAAEGRAGDEAVVVISRRLAERLGAPDHLPGTRLLVDGAPTLVVGVMAPGFLFPEQSDLWLPYQPVAETNRGARYLDLVLARLAPGASLRSLQPELNTWANRLARAYPGSNRDWTVRALSLHRSLVDAPTRQVLWLMVGAVGLVLLVACANVTNLLLARETTRYRERAIQLALGSGRGRLIRQALLESVLLSLGGGVLGLLLAAWSIDLILTSNPEPLPFHVHVRLDPPVFLASLAIAAGCGLVFGLLPALRSAHLDPAQTLKAGIRSGGHRHRRRLIRALVAVEVAASLPLLLTAALLVQSYLAITGTDAGFDTERLLVLRTHLPAASYPDVTAASQVLERVVTEVERLPAVERAAFTGAVPLDDGGGSARLAVRGSDRETGQELEVTYVGSTAGFFDTLGLPLIAGTGPTPQQAMDPEAAVAVVNTALAATLWPGQDPLGRQIRLGEGSWLTVTGLVPDLHYEELGEETPRSRLQVHLPYAQAPWRTLALLIRTHGDPAAVAPGVRQALRQIDPQLPVFDLRTMTEVRVYTAWGQRLQGVLFGTFATLGLVLAAVGLYGVVAFGVSQRWHEIGVRMALGARRSQVVGAVVTEGLAPVLAGLVVGLALAVAAARLLEGLLFGVATHDLLTLVCAPLLLLLTAGAAALLPARRAASVEPVSALRAE